MTRIIAHQPEPISAQPYELAHDLRAFARSPAGTLDDVSALRRDVEEAVALAKRQAVPCPDVEIADRESEPGLRVRVYRPRSAARLPALIYCHGGAFLLGSPELEDPGCVRYALGASCAVISVDYRLAPEHRFPAGLEDCFAALKWAVRQHDGLGIDPARIAVGGSSAGGALAAALALMARDRGGPEICYQMLIYPVLDDRLDTPSMVRFVDTPVFARPTAAAMWRHYLGDEPAPVPAYAAPARAADLSGLPPAYIEACALDPLRDEDIAYASRLLQAANRTELHVIPGAPHGFDQFYLGAPGAVRWPVPSEPLPGDAARAPIGTDPLSDDLAGLPAITRRVIANRIAALRSALHSG